MKYLQQEDPQRAWILDLEADDLKATQIWVVVVKNLATGEVKSFRTEEEFNTWYDKTHILIGHNLISFDIPVINRLWNSGISLESLVDTLVLSYNYKASIDDGHSLEAWGRRLKFPKGAFNDWSKFSQEMLTYCINDVELTFKLYESLTKRMREYGYSEQSCWIEHQIRIIIDEQQANGFWFNRERGVELRDKLKSAQHLLAEQIQKLFPPELREVARYTLRRTKNGGHFASHDKHLQKYHLVKYLDKAGNEVSTDEAVEYVCMDYEEFNLGSPKQRVERLLSLGWEPTKFTEKDFPKVDEDALLEFSEKCGRPEVQALSEWLVLQGRTSMLDTWFNNLGADSRIHGRILTCGASTRRMTHFKPNTANIPSGAKAKYGKECRELWGVEPDKGLIQVGVDASGLENVALLHYLNNPKATEVLNRPKPNDIHSVNARTLSQLLGREIDREWGSKTSYFATLYGAYPPKIAQILKGTKEEGVAAQNILYSSVPGLNNLVEKCKDELSSCGARLISIDGGFVWCPSVSASLNYKCQSLGSIVMKLACILLFKRAKEISLWFQFLANVHDEWQMETKKEDGDTLGKLAVECIQEAAIQLKLNLPLTGVYKLGYNWGECH